MSEHAIAHGDVLAVLRQLPSDSFDALLCDPPYGFSFMGKKWDYDVPSTDTWREALRVLKPGAPLLSFGGARTFHRIAIGIEDAGFELRDCLMWLYGKGFPKSQNIGLAIDKAAGATREVVGSRVLTGNAAISTKDKGGTYGVQVGSIPPKTVDVTAPATDLAQQWDGYGTALKPAYEPILLARKPLVGTMAANVAAHGVGGLAIDACKIARAVDDVSGYAATGSKAAPNLAMGRQYERAAKPDDAGRWPANLILDDDSAAALDASVPPTKSAPYKANQAAGAVLPMETRTAGGYDEPAGGPSRFFYCAKVSTKERERGCDALPMRSAGEVTEREDGSAGLDNPRAGAGRTGGARNHHPTLKPIALTKWLASLIKPPTAGAKLLVPFSGAGSEMIGALQAGWPLVLGIEGEAEYIAIAHARIAAWRT
jgi:site-specific DNA-methyltransferase (adenine-specific)